MNKVLILAIALVLISLVFSKISENFILDAMKDKPKKEIFKVFHFLHKKDYNLNSKEGIRRYKIFKENLKWVKRKNSEIGEEVFGITKFMDMINEEFEKIMLMNSEMMEKTIEEFEKNSLKNPNSFLANNNLFDSYVDEDEDEILRYNFKTNLKQNQTTIDWRSKLNGIRDQGRCGSCWAFAAIASIEGAYNIKYGKLYDLSEQYLVDCDDMDGGCNGGWPSNTFEWISRNGLVQQYESQYKGKRQVCEVQKFKSKEIKIVTGAKMYSSQYDRSYWYKLLKEGPLIVAMDAGVEGFAWYRPSDGQPFFPKNCRTINHAVVVVGNEFIDGNEYLIVRNSWGQNWGIEGYFKIPSNNACGIFTFGWLAEVTNGTPDPIPPPVPSDCFEYFEKCGYNGFSYKICEGNYETEFPVAGIKFPTSGKFYFPSITLFSLPECQGKSLKLTHSHECFTDDLNRIQLYRSFAIEKTNKEGCILFYRFTCTVGMPIYEICSDIPDFLILNNSNIPEIKSMIFDSNTIESVTFFDSINYIGKAYSVSTRDPILNVSNSNELSSILKNVRSIIINKRK